MPRLNSHQKLLLFFVCGVIFGKVAFIGGLGIAFAMIALEPYKIFTTN